MKALRRHFMKIGSGRGKNVTGWKQRRSRRFIRPELPDDTLVENVRFTTRIRKTLHAAGMKTIGDVGEVSDAALLSLPDFGSGSLSYLREALGLPSIDGMRPKIKKPT
jgi:DNA-directed RNA polymerase alpha subunit